VANGRLIFDPKCADSGLQAAAAGAQLVDVFRRAGAQDALERLAEPAQRLGKHDLIESHLSTLQVLRRNMGRNAA